MTLLNVNKGIDIVRRWLMKIYRQLMREDEEAI